MPTTVLPKPRPGVLTSYNPYGKKYGSLTKVQRQNVLTRAMQATTPVTMLKRLVLLRNFARNKNPKFAAKLTADITWIQKVRRHLARLPKV